MKISEKEREKTIKIVCAVIRANKLNPLGVFGVNESGNLIMGTGLPDLKAIEALESILKDLKETRKHIN